MRLLFVSALVASLAGCASLSPKAPAVASPTQAVLIVPESIDVMKLDQESHNYLNRNGELRLAVSPGAHRLQLRYQQLFNQGSDQQEVITSDTLTYPLTVVAGKEYRIQHPVLNTPDAARDFATELPLQLQVDGQSSPLQPSRTELPAEVSATPAPAVVPAQQGDSTDSPTLQQLKHWWLQATPAEQEAFFRWKAR